MRNTGIRLISAIVVILNFVIAMHVHADPQPAREYRHPKSACIVRSSAGDYPLYTVFKNHKSIFAPTSDGIVAVVFSPAGRYVALVGSGIDGVNASRPRPDAYGVVIVDCVSGTATGFLEPYRSGKLHWKSNTTFTFTSDENGVLYELRVDSP